MKKNAFTIIEVVVSILIISIVGVGIMGSSSNYVKFFSHLEKKSLDFEALSLIGINANEKLHSSTKSLYDIASNEFFIENDKVLEYLKGIEFYYQETKPESKIKARETSTQEWQKEIKNDSQLEFGVTKISISGDNLSGVLFTIRSATP